MYALILGFILGANEIWWVLTTGLTNPFFLFFLILCAGVGFAIWKLNLMPVIIAVATPIQQEVQNYIKFRLGMGGAAPSSTTTTTTTADSKAKKD
jgi:hypothetical protein